VSMLVTPVACRYLLGEQHHASTGFAHRVERRIDAIAEAYSRLLRRALSMRLWVIGGALLLVATSAVVAPRLPSTFLPEIDESMERIYVRMAPGTSIEAATRKVSEMGRMLAAELPPGTVKLWLSNVGDPRKARSAINSPNSGPHMGYLRLELGEAHTR